MLEQQRLALGLGQFGQGLHQQQGLLVALGPLAGGGLFDGQPGIEPDRGLLDRSLEGSLQRQVAAAAAVVPDRIGQRAGEGDRRMLDAERGQHSRAEDDRSTRDDRVAKWFPGCVRRSNRRALRGITARTGTDSS
jgi:hypothetical protein